MISNSSKILYGFIAVVTIGIFGTVIFSNLNSNKLNANNESSQLSGPVSANNTIASSKSELIADKKDFSFGDINIYGGKVSTNLTLSNNGTEPLTLTDISSSCMCTTATIDDQTFGMPMGGMTNPKANITIAPNSSKTLTVTFDPLAHGDNGTGPITRVISIETNSTATPTLELKVSGNVIKP